MKKYTGRTPLCKIGAKYKTDKSPLIKHTYTHYYWDLLKDKRETIKKVFEFGVGHPKADSYIRIGYETGASLKMWRDFFPNAQIYGADISEKCLFEEERIKTFRCDERNSEMVRALISRVGSDIDLFIDDASHFWRNQVNLAKTVMPLLKKDVIYIIEDVLRPDYVLERLEQYDCHVAELIKKKYKDSCLIIVKNK